MARFKQLPKELQELLKKLRPTVRRAYLNTISDITKSVDFGDVVAAINVGNADEVIRLLNLDASFFSPVDRAINEIYWQSGSSVALKIKPSQTSAPILPFDGRTPNAEAWVRQQAGTLITNVLNDQKAMTREVLEYGLRRSRHPSTIALDLVGRVSKATKRREGGFIGLTTGQTRAVEAARTELLSGDPAELRKYLKRRLRNRTFDRTVEKAIREGTKIPAKKVTEMINRYTDRSLKYRAELIAKNEALTAVEAARDEAHKQLIDNGTLEREQIRPTWRHAGSPEPRPDHIEMDGVSIAFGDLFVLPDGVQMKSPHDPAGPAKHNLGCNCWTDFVIANHTET